MATSRLCSILNCNKPVKHMGWCSAHYFRWRDHGDPVGGGTSKGEPLRFLYETVLTYKGDECLTWPYATDGTGRGHINIARRDWAVHRFVCIAVHGLPPTPKHEVAHLCGRGDKACVAQTHLYWATHKENEADKLKHGTRLCGASAPRAKFTLQEVSAIRALRGTVSQKTLARQLGVRQGTISRIQNGKAYRD